MWDQVPVVTPVPNNDIYARYKEKWDFCNINTQCISGCCSKLWSDDGRLKCHDQEACILDGGGTRSFTDFPLNGSGNGPGNGSGGNGSGSGNSGSGSGDNGGNNGSGSGNNGSGSGNNGSGPGNNGSGSGNNGGNNGSGSGSGSGNNGSNSGGDNGGGNSSGNNNGGSGSGNNGNNSQPSAAIPVPTHGTPTGNSAQSSNNGNMEFIVIVVAILLAILIGALIIFIIGRKRRKEGIEEGGKGSMASSNSSNNWDHENWDSPVVMPYSTSNNQPSNFLSGSPNSNSSPSLNHVPRSQNSFNSTPRNNNIQYNNLASSHAPILQDSNVTPDYIGPIPGIAATSASPFIVAAIPPSENPSTGKKDLARKITDTSQSSSEILPFTTNETLGLGNTLNRTSTRDSLNRTAKVNNSSGGDNNNLLVAAIASTATVGAGAAVLAGGKNDGKNEMNKLMHNLASANEQSNISAQSTLFAASDFSKSWESTETVNQFHENTYNKYNSYNSGEIIDEYTKDDRKVVVRKTSSGIVENVEKIVIIDGVPRRMVKTFLNGALIEEFELSTSTFSNQDSLSVIKEESDSGSQLRNLAVAESDSGASKSNVTSTDGEDEEIEIIEEIVYLENPPQPYRASNYEEDFIEIQEELADADSLLMLAAASTNRKPSTDTKSSLEIFLDNQVDEPDLSAYVPPPPTDYVVAIEYNPIQKDELHMQKGDLVGIECTFADNWARGQNMSQGRKRGFFPLSILTPIKSGPSQTVIKADNKQFLSNITSPETYQDQVRKPVAITARVESKTAKRKSTEEIFNAKAARSKFERISSTQTTTTTTITTTTKQVAKQINVSIDKKTDVKTSRKLSKETLRKISNRSLSINSKKSYEQLKDKVSLVSPLSRLNWRFFVRKCRLYDPCFEVRTFLERLIASDEVSRQNFVSILSYSNLVNVNEDICEDLLGTLAGESQYAIQVLTHLRDTVREIGVDQFLETSIDVTTEANFLAQSEGFVAKVLSIGDLVQFNLVGFVNACVDVNPEFDFNKYLNTLVAIPAEYITHDNLHKAFEDSDIFIPRHQFFEIMEVLVGDNKYLLQIMSDWIGVLKSVGVSRFIESIDDFFYNEAEEEVETETFLTKVMSLSPRSKFALNEFRSLATLLSSSEFNLKKFLTLLTESEEVNFDEQLVSLLEISGIQGLSQENYRRLVIVFFGDYNLRFRIIKELQMILQAKGVEWFLGNIFISLESRSEIDGAGRAFVARIFGISSSITFDYRSFTALCKRCSVSFEPKIFLDELSLLDGPISDDNILIDLFNVAGWKITHDEYLKVMQELCGDIGLRHRVMEELRTYLFLQQTARYFIKYIFIWLEERESADFALKQFFFKLRKYKNIQFDLYGFIAQCQLHYSSFEIKIFLEILANISKNRPITIDVLQESFELSGISNLSQKECADLISLLFGDFEKGLELLFDMVQTSKLGVSGIEYLLVYYYGWIDIVKDFYAKVHAISMHAKFDLEAFLSTCISLNEKFDIKMFLEKFMKINDPVQVEDIHQLFKDCGINMPQELYEMVVGSLCGKYDTHLAVFVEWKKTLESCGVDTFVRITSSTKMDVAPLTQSEIITSIKVFLLKISLFGPNVKFDQKTFVSRCLTYHRRFDVKIFVRRLLMSKEISFSIIHKTLQNCGVKISGKECQDLLVVLTGDIVWSMKIVECWVKAVGYVGADSFFVNIDAVSHKNIWTAESEEEIINSMKEFNQTQGKNVDIPSFVRHAQTILPSFSFSTFVRTLVSFSKSHILPEDSIAWLIDGFGLGKVSTGAREEAMIYLGSDPNIYYEISACISFCSPQAFESHYSK